MIKPSDIAVSVEPSDAYPNQRIRAGLKLSMERRTVSDGSVEIDRETRRCREEIWHHIYGDIELEIGALERAVFPLLAIQGGCDTAASAFKKFRELLAYKDPSE